MFSDIIKSAPTRHGHTPQREPNCQAIAISEQFIVGLRLQYAVRIFA